MHYHATVLLQQFHQGRNLLNVAAFGSLESEWDGRLGDFAASLLKLTFDKLGRKLGSLCKFFLLKIEKNRPYWAENHFLFCFWCDT